MPDSEVTQDKILRCANPKCGQRIESGNFCLDCKFEMEPVGDNFPEILTQEIVEEVQCH